MSYTRLDNPGELTEVQLELSADQYMRYLGGVALLTQGRDSKTLQLFNIAPDESDTEVLYIAEDLMYNGLRKMIHRAGGEGKPADAYEQQFHEIIPRLQRVQGHAYTSRVELIEGMNRLLTIFRPLPVADESVFKQLCHARKSNITTLSLLDDMRIDLRFRNVITGKRKLGSK